MLEKIAFTLALLSAATVAALPRYHEWQRMDYEDMTARVTANIQMISGGPCAQVKEEENGITYVVRICEAEDEDVSNVCHSTRVKPCCPIGITPAHEKSRSTVIIGGASEEESVTVAFYFADEGLCYRLDDAHLRAEGCGDCSHNEPQCRPIITTPYCTLNCLKNGTIGCERCKDGYVAVPECCNCDDGYEKTESGECKRIQSCSVDQNIFFLLDGTEANSEFCPMAIVIHMLAAVFNPKGSTSGTRLSTVLFSNGNIAPSVVFSLQDNCSAIQDHLKDLQQDFQHCTGRNNYDYKFDSICATSTRAVKGLETIRDLISDTQKANALVIITDGQIDTEEDPTAVLEDLRKKGVQTILAAVLEGSGAEPIDTIENLKRYTINNNKADIVRHKDVTSLGIHIVEKMKQKRIICEDLATNATEALEELKNRTTTRDFSFGKFCPCQRDGSGCYDMKYPECGGSLSLNYELPPEHGKNLEEEILAAVVSVLEENLKDKIKH